ncbi:class I SAM-dependent methyltransferase [Fusibacter sp. JL298sf-3]
MLKHRLASNCRKMFNCYILEMERIMSLLSKLIEQAKNPRGTLGGIMVSIMNSAHKKMMIWGLSNIEIEETASILDIGCGGGINIKLLLNRATKGEVTGVDYSYEAVKQSTIKNKKAVYQGLVKVKHGNVESLPFANGEFDLVTAVQTHYFWPDIKGSIIEIKRVLKSGGRVLILAENYKMNYHMNSYETSSKLIKLMYELGFTDLQIHEKNDWMCLTGCS